MHQSLVGLPKNLTAQEVQHDLDYQLYSKIARNDAFLKHFLPFMSEGEIMFEPMLSKQLNYHYPYRLLYRVIED